MDAAGPRAVSRNHHFPFAIPAVLAGRPRGDGPFHRRPLSISRPSRDGVLQPAPGKSEAARTDRKIPVEETRATLAAAGNLASPQTPLPRADSPMFLQRAGARLRARIVVAREIEGDWTVSA